MDCYENLITTGRVVCPKPRRVGPSNFSNSVMPLRYHLRNGAEAFDSRAGAELLDSTLCKMEKLENLVVGAEKQSAIQGTHAKEKNYHVITQNIETFYHVEQEGFQGEGCATVSSSPPFFFGSPPCRAQNPLAQDAHFRVQKHGPTASSPSDSASLPSSHSRVNFGNKQATVRVEGFDCQSRVTASAMA